MIRLKQKKAEEEKKAVAEAEKQQTEEKGASLSETSGISDSNTTTATTTAAGESGVNSSSGGGGLKLLGIGGKSTRTNGEGTGKTTGKKKTPGEIRIQKGMYIYIFTIRSYFCINL